MMHVSHTNTTKVHTPFTLTYKLYKFSVERQKDFNKENSTFWTKQIFARVFYLGLIPCIMATALVDTFHGLGKSIVVLVHITKQDPVLDPCHLSRCANIVTGIYACILKTINPKSEIGPLKSNNNSYGLISGPVADILNDVAANQFGSGKFFRKQITTRLTYALLACSLLVTRTAEGIIGVAITPFSLLTLGKITRLNNLTFRCLRAPIIIGEIICCAFKILRPDLNVECTSS